MVILQKPNHVLRWYGLVVSLAVFAATVWLMHAVFDSIGAGAVLGAVLFFAVWAVLVVIHVPFAVLLGVDPERSMVQVGSEKFPFADIQSVQPYTRPAGKNGAGLEVEHTLVVAGYANPIVLYPAAAKRQMDRTQLEAYRSMLTELDLGPSNPVVRREQHGLAGDGGTEAGAAHPLDGEVDRAKALKQVQGLLGNPQFSGGPAPEGLEEGASAQYLMYNVHPQDRSEFPEFFHGGSTEPASRPERTLEHHRSVVQDLGERITRRTAWLGHLRRVLAWALGAALVVLVLSAVVTWLSGLPQVANDAADLTLSVVLVLTVIFTVGHALVFDLHVRRVRREGERLIAPPSSSARSVAAVLQHWRGLYETEKNHEWSSTDAYAAPDPRDPEWNPEQAVFDSGAVPTVLSEAWSANPRRSLQVLAVLLGLAAAVMVGFGLERGEWFWHLGAAGAVAAGIGAWIRTDRNKSPKRQDLRAFAHSLEALRISR